MESRIGDDGPHLITDFFGHAASFSTRYGFGLFQTIVLLLVDTTRQKIFMPAIVRGDFMRTSLKVLLCSVTAIAISAPALAQSTTPALQYAKQGWTVDDRQAFYTTSQGSHIIPYLWFKALRRLDADEPFGGDQLARYGYLPNDKSKLNPEGLPVGFVIDGDVSTGFFGMTCAACHTGQIEYQKNGATQQLRIDGAPATADIQLFLKDLTDAARGTLNEDARYDKFARAVLGNRYSATRAKDLKTDFAAWVKQWGDFMDKSLPASPWGPARLDAFGMIFNRVAGKDLGIDANIQAADAPVSYPFLWNASRQDKTQWNGAVPNGLFINAIGRNAGEVLGVFADFTPRRQLLLPFVNYSRSSIKFANLQQAEEKIAMLTAPPWPFELKQDLVDKGRVLYARECGSCHEEKRLPEGKWLTPVQAVGTDPKMFDNAQNRTSQTGILAGQPSPNPPGSKLSNPAATNDVLATTVVNALFQDAFPPLPRFPNPKTSGVWQAVGKDLQILLPELQLTSLSTLLQDRSMVENLKTQIRDRLGNMFKGPGDPHAYESRVLHGIWATAPYLHNGSVPNLWELLTPPAQRRASFMVGSRKYDPVNVGYVTDESPFKNGKLVVGGPDVVAGNGNAGHDYGTSLSDDEKWQLIEYLKQL
jgi:mono/diheme cytochrome c family protein